MDRSYSTLVFLNQLKRKGKTYDQFENRLECLQKAAISEGLDETEMKLLADVVQTSDIGAMPKVALIKCLIPRGLVEKSMIQDMLEWCISSLDNLPFTVAVTFLQWVTGVWEHQLTDRKHISIYYQPLFYDLINRPKLVPQLSMLIYAMTTPSKVTRRQVHRIEELRKTLKTPNKYLNALLSLFKAYKAEMVPQKIDSVNIQSIWKALPESIESGFEAAKSRVFASQDNRDYLDWHDGTRKKNRKTEPLIPSVGYFRMGSDERDKKDKKSLFDLSSLEDLGKHQLDVELPAEATSLLHNQAGHHLLTFADGDYQSRFAYNLYHTLRRGFLLESEKYSKEERQNVLRKTAKFCLYMQQGIPLLDYFLMNYLATRNGDDSKALLLSLRWAFTLASDYREQFFQAIENMFEEASLQKKCEILKSLRILLTNIYVAARLEDKPAPFMGQKSLRDVEDVILAITIFAGDLITTGLIVHNFHGRILADALTFYEEVCVLQSQSKLQVWTIAPVAVIHGSFATDSCIFLSRLCDLLLSYRELSRLVRRSDNVTAEIFIKKLNIYANDVASSFMYKKAVKERNEKGRLFLKSLSEKVCRELEFMDLDDLLSFNKHAALLPYQHKYKDTISSKEDFLAMISKEVPSIGKFMKNVIEAKKMKMDLSYLSYKFA